MWRPRAAGGDVLGSANSRFCSAAQTDAGPVRDHNEDRILVDDGRGFFAVVDGMGGHNAGEKAAEIAVERIRARLERQTDSTEQRIREAITLANNAVLEAGEAHAAWNGMACVLTLAVLEDGHAVVGHVGDSRLYKIRAGEIQKITNDHSPVGEREDAGELTEAEARAHPRRNEVFRDVGSEARTPDDPEFIEIQRVPFEPDCALLLCSDGLSDVLDSREILDIVERNAADCEAAVSGLIAAANANSKDNVSAILVEGPGFPAAVGPRAAAGAGVAGRAAGDRWYLRSAYVAAGLVAGLLLAYLYARLQPAPAPQRHAPETLRVAEPHTIGSVVEQAAAGDTVSVAPGVYHETLKLKSGVNVVAQEAHRVTLEGGIVADDVARARVEGLVVHAAEVGIASTNSAVEIARCEVSGAAKAGVVFSGDARGSLLASFVHDNAGPGVVVGGTATPSIENNVIIGNGTRAGELRPGVELKTSGTPLVTGNIFLANGAEPIWTAGTDEKLASRNYFSVATGKAAKNPVRVVTPRQP